MAKLSYGEITDEVLRPLSPPGALFYVPVALLGAGIVAFVSTWVFQVRTGMGVAGISHPVGWGVYIANFVFWVGIAHSGTLISAILHLVRSKWRAAVSRSAEAMTVFAVMTAGLFPLIHLGRLWVFYYILPYPSERQLWPNFTSPLVWDVCAVSTYFTVSVIFFYVGLIPDLASARDRTEARLGYDHPRSRFYRRLALGWAGSAAQWRHYGRGYLYFAALATPLVISVHSVVSWDFAMALLPGWHETIFPPYFVAGAIHSGLAMVLTLLIPLRRLLRLERIITVEHFDAVARTILVTTCIIGYAYVIEGLMPRYSGNRFEEQFAHWRETGSMAWAYWALFLLNVFFPLSFAFRRLRRNLNWLFIVSILMNVGMWLERYHIIATATWHDFLPHNWGPYAPTWVEGTITAGAFAFFLFWFFNFARLLPTVAASEVKEILAEQQTHGVQVGLPADKHGKIAMSKEGILAVFHEPDEMMEALRALRRAAFRRLELFSPVKVGEVDKVLGLPHGPVRFWTLSGALLGMAGGFALALGSAGVNNLVVGGKPPMAYIPYCIVGFEGTILLGTLANLTGLIVHARLGRTKLPPAYDPRFSRDKFGLLVECPAERLDEVRDIIRPMEPEEVHVIG